MTLARASCKGLRSGLRLLSNRAPARSLLPECELPESLIYSEDSIASAYADGSAENYASKDALKRRIAGVALTLLAELLVIALLLTLGWNLSGEDDNAPQITTFEARDVSSDPPASVQGPVAREIEAPDEPLPELPQPEPQPQPQTEPVEAQELPRPIELNPPPVTLPSPRPTPQPPTPPAPKASPKPAKPSARVYGPPDTGPPASQFDSKRVGTAPNGEPMYAARWYREPTRQEMSGYLSTASGPGTALIVCKTMPGYYVEDCELLGESPRGSQIGRAVLAAAWQFRVRPAIVGGRSQFGSWVRIRIDYTQTIRR